MSYKFDMISLEIDNCLNFTSQSHMTYAEVI